MAKFSRTFQDIFVYNEITNYQIGTKNALNFPINQYFAQLYAKTLPYIVLSTTTGSVNSAKHHVCILR